MLIADLSLPLFLFFLFSPLFSFLSSFACLSDRVDGWPRFRDLLLLLLLPRETVIIIVGDDLLRTRNVSGMRRRRFCAGLFIESVVTRYATGDNEDERVKLVIFGSEKKFVLFFLFSLKF